MKEYCCTKCGKKFIQKIDLIRHSQKKYSCVSEHELVIMIASGNEDLMKLETLFNKLRNILRDHESITGRDALDVFSDILFLRLINPMLQKTKKGVYLDIVDYEYTNEKANKYKQYIYWNNIMEQVKKIKKDGELEDKEELLTTVQTIFNIIFKLYPITKSIFCDKLFSIKKSITLVKMFEEINKINFEEMDVDVKGKAYELTIQKEASVSKDFGQYFTPRWVVKYIIGQLNPIINKDGSFDKVMDPACGTGGFISEYYKFIKNKADKDDITLKKNSGSNLYGYEIVPKTRELALINNLLNTGIYNDNIKGLDFLENSNDYINSKFKGHIITNPPFAMDKDYESLFSDGEKNEYSEIFPVKTKSGTFLFLQACANIIEDGYNICMVSPNGKEIFGKGKDHIEIRKNTMESCNVYKIALLPSQSFKPYTGVETLVLFMKKGSKTKEIKFVQLMNNKDTITEKELVKVKYDQLKEKNYTWNYKDYVVENPLKHIGTLKYEKLEDMCEFLNGKRRSVSETEPLGYYNFYTCSIFGPEKSNNCDHTDYGIIMNAINGNGKCNVFFDKNYSTTSNNIHFQVKKHVQKFVYYYLKINLKILEDGFVGNNQKKISQDYIKSIQIPVPPLEVQEQIVKELDSYYKTKEAIQVQLDEMLQFKKGKFNMLLEKCINIKNRKLGDISEYRKKTLKLKASDGKETGKYRFYSSSAKVLFNDHKEFTEKSLILSRGGDAYINVDVNFSISHDDIYVLSLSENYEYIKYYLLSKIDDLRTGYKGNTIKHINQDFVNDFNIELPSKEDQEKIVKEMEKDDELEKILNDKLKEIDILVKNRFDFHINKCKNVGEKNKDTLKVKLIKESTDKSESELSDDDDFDSLGIKLKDLKQLDLKTTDCCTHYYHKKNNCVYTRSLKTNKWHKPEKSQQKQLLDMMNDVDNSSSNESEDEQPKKIHKKITSKKKQDSYSGDENPIKKKK